MMLSVPVFAIKDGETLNYESEIMDCGFPLFDIDGNQGFCIEPGVEEAEEGTAEAELQSRNSRIAKTAYYIAKKGWDQNLNARSSSTGLMNGSVVTAMLQYAAKGNAAIEVWRGYGYWDQDTYDKIVSYVNNAQELTVPNSFKVFTFNAGSHQDFGVFYVEPTGSIKLKKASANPSITG